MDALAVLLQMEKNDELTLDKLDLTTESGRDKLTRIHHLICPNYKMVNVFCCKSPLQGVSPENLSGLATDMRPIETHILLTDALNNKIYDPLQIYWLEKVIKESKC